MLLDAQNMFSDGQAVTATAPSDNIIDLIEANPVFDKAPEFFAQVMEAFATLTSLTFTLETSADKAFSAPVKVFESDAIAAADLVQGYRWGGVLPKTGLLQHVRMKYTVGGSNATAGSLDAALVMNTPS